MVVHSQERFILVKTGLFQDFHSIWYILTLGGGGGKKTQNTKKTPKIPKSQCRKKYSKE